VFWKEEDVRNMIGENLPSTGMFVFFLISNFPLQPLKKYIFASSLPLDYFWVGGDWGIEGIEVQVV
jgi:hypothetical protein